jgi:hypothetical protein
MNRVWTHCIGFCFVASLPACGGAQPRPEAPPGSTSTSQTPAAGSEPVGGAAPSNATKPPFTGTFRLLNGTDGTQTIGFSELMKRGARAGEVVIGLDDKGFSLGVWYLNKDQHEPNQTLYSLCRGRVALSPQWDGNTMVLPAKLAVQGWSDAVHVETQRSPPNKTKTSTWKTASSCEFSLDAGKYKFEVLKSDGEGPSALRMVTDKATFELDRTAPIDAIDPKSVIASVKSE